MAHKEFRILCCFFFLLTSCFYSRAQFSKAAFLIENGDYETAKAYYVKVLQKDSLNFSANQELGLLLLQYYDEKEAALSYLDRAVRIIKKKELLPELYLGFAQALHYTSHYEDAINYYNKIIPIVSNDESGRKMRKQVTLNIANCRYAIQNPPTKKSMTFRVRNIGSGINTAYPEFLPVTDVENSMLLYTTHRNVPLGNKKDLPEDKTQGDMFIATRATGKIESGLPYSKRNYKIELLDSIKETDNVLSISTNGKHILFISFAQLYYCQKNGNTWSKPEPLPKAINSSLMFEGTACISNDGKTIYFSSSKAGSYGGKDIYKSTLNEAGIWTEPENLGEDINTDEDEDNPFLNSDENTFYFSSKGLDGYGGYDVYKAKITAKGVSKPVNLGLPLNSPADDINFSLNAKETEGYLTSSRKGGFGDLDIYQIFYFGKPTPQNCIAVYNPKPTENPYIDFTLRDSIFVNDSVLFDAKISSVKEGAVLNYFWRVNDSLVVSDTSAFTKKFIREGKTSVSLEAAVFSETADARKEYCLTREVFTFNPKTIDAFFEPLVLKNENKLAITGTVDVVKIKIDSTKRSVLNIKLEPIFFATNNFDISKDAAEAIKRNISKMKQDPNIIIKLTALTDPRSSKEYNLTLSQKRANSVVAYLEKNGIKKKRIIAVLALGEEEAKIKNCGNDVACQEKVYQQNRRVEFKIVGAEYEAPKATKVAKKPVAGKKPKAKKTAAKKKK